MSTKLQPNDSIQTMIYNGYDKYYSQFHYNGTNKFTISYNKDKLEIQVEFSKSTPNGLEPITTGITTQDGLISIDIEVEAWVNYYVKVIYVSGYSSYTISSEYEAIEEVDEIREDRELITEISGGEDWYKTTFNEDGNASIYLQMWQDLDVDLYVYKSDKTTLLGKSSKNKGLDELVKISAKSGEIYFIKIRHFSGTGWYNLRCTNHPLIPEPEIENDQDVTGSILEDENKWYRVTFDGDGNANFFVNPNPNLNVDLYVYESDKITELARKRDGELGQHELIKELPVQGGKEYYIRIEQRMGTGNFDFRCKKYSADEMINQFPTHYRSKLETILTKHPTWILEPMNLSIKWDDFILAQGKYGKNLVNIPPRPLSWKDPTDNTEYYVNWRAAANHVIEYFADPRNYFDEKHLFVFEKLSFDPQKHTKDGIRVILKNTFMDTEEYVNYFMNAAITYETSPYFLASKVSLEMGDNGCSLAFGTVPGYEGYYNYFNINANGSDPALNGAIHAQNQGWDTIEKSINGGAEFCSKKYISIGQDTKYLFKFDLVDSLYNNQYVQNIEAAYTECVGFYDGYNASGSLENTFVFKIPVFEEMPDVACPQP